MQPVCVCKGERTANVLRFLFQGSKFNLLRAVQGVSLSLEENLERVEGALPAVHHGDGAL